MSRFFIKGRIRYEHSFRKTDTSQLSFITNAKDDSRKMICKMNDKKKEKFMKKIISLLLLVIMTFVIIFATQYGKLLQHSMKIYVQI